MRRPWTRSPHIALASAHLRESFAEANERLVARLRGADDEAARRAPEGGWSAAQIGWHVASVTTRFAGLMSGDLPGAQPLRGRFPRAAVAARSCAPIADRSQAPASVQPPPGVTRDGRPSPRSKRRA